ncbi:hypothetical protein UVI_02007360 [Ustilaginoidea virens]|uniref:Polycomb protein VEFS-Box domain-containing protein n=1 Tax=Ustilaginoidea virens TaxID=1159556 RepID=A0A1B5KV74_USTVR|nr:hypothetical protein UVI_02007360 [Ustilaginoidea virens]
MHKLPQVPHHGEANEARPTKRRRISSPDALDIDHLIASPRMSESGSTLRIEVLKILHKDSKRVKSYQPALPCDVLAIKARCKVTILDTSSGPPQVLHCQSQMCDLTTFKNPAGPHRVARVDLPRPFFVPHYSILINRPDDGGFDLSDSYQVLIELESANSIHWPPLDSHDFGIPAETLYSPWCTTQHWTLSSRFDAVFGRLKNPLSLSTRYPSDQSSYQTNYVMDVDLRWTAGLKTPRQLDKGSMSCITAVDPDSDLFSNNVISPLANGTVVNGINGHVDAVESPKDHEDEFGGDQTPSRSLRARAKNKVYNLKILSDQQLERDKKQRGQSPHEATSQGRVQYLLPSDQPISLDFYRCISCGAYHESMDQLRLHLQHWHPHFEYILENSNQGPLFRVSPLRELTASPQRTHCLVRTAKPFSIQTLSSGDQSWLKSRLGPDGDEPFRSPVKATLGRLSAGSPVAKVPQPATRRLRGAQVKKALVPDISLPLFHPISKARLKAGQEVPQPIPDNTWLIQKHRESISDFSDVTPAEKEYIWEWDGYILRQNITSAAYFARAWLSFVAEKAAWLVGARGEQSV